MSCVDVYRHIVYMVGGDDGLRYHGVVSMSLYGEVVGGVMSNVRSPTHGYTGKW